MLVCAAHAGSPLGFNVGAVSATDPDVNGKFVYILNSTTSKAFDASGNPVNMTNATYNYMVSFTHGFGQHCARYGEYCAMMTTGQ